MTDKSEYRWDLKRFSQDSAGNFAEELDNGLKEVLRFAETYRGKIGTLSPSDLHQALQSYEKLQENILKPQYYAHLLFAADSGSEEAKKLSQQAAEAGNRFSRELLFFDLELMALPEEKFAAILNEPLLANYHHHLSGIRKFSRFTLPEREEQLLKRKDLTGCDAFTRLFDELSASLSFRMELDGEEREFTGEELLGLLHHPDRSVRERAFTLFLEGHGDHVLVYGAVFNNIALDHGQEMEIRGYSHPMEPTNIGNELSGDIVGQLMTVSEANYPLARDYFRLKARLLGIDKLKNSDVYAPVTESPKKYTLEQAKDLVVAAYGNFNRAYIPLVESFFTESRVDVYPRSGKSGGAFCMGMTPAIPPYLLLNFTSNLRDVSTMAHEMGHGLHYLLAAKQSLLNYHAPLPLAETASVFGEMLLTRELLKKENDKRVKISLLCAKIEDIIATTFRQVVLTRFEERLHLERSDGLLTDSRLCEIWLEENGKLYGDAVTMIDAYRWGWSYISHFIHARFYCYSYTFAELLVLALYREYLNKGDAFVPGYEAILSSGGSRSPYDTAALAGIDISAPGFWQQGYDILETLIEELKELL